VKRYPQAGAAVERGIKEGTARRGCKPAELVSELARGLNVKPQTIDTWRRGVRRMPEGLIEPFVRMLDLPVSSEKGREIFDSILAGRSNEYQIKTWIQEADEDRFVLKVCNAKYRGAGRFWQRLFSGFLSAADIRLKTTTLSNRNFEELQRAVWLGQLDVALGILCTPRLQLKLWFFQSPISYRLNAIILASDLERIQKLTRPRKRPLRGSDPLSYAREALSARRRRWRVFLPIAKGGEIGELYAINNLGFSFVHRVDFDAQQFATALQSAELRRDGKVPLAIVDEITCLSILLKLNGEGRLLFPLTPNPGERRVLIPPSFPLGICVSRNEDVGHARKRELMVFLGDALSAHILGDAANIARGYLALRSQITRLVRLALPLVGEAERTAWVDRTFSLGESDADIHAPHWRAVLRAAKRSLATTSR
jgi:hypothetical protein